MKFKHFATAQTQRQTTASIYCHSCASQSAWLLQELCASLRAVTWKQRSRVRDSTLPTSSKLDFWTENLCGHQNCVDTSLKCRVLWAPSWSTWFPWAMQHSGLPTDPYALHFPIIEMIREWLFFFLTWVLINESIYLIFHPLITTGNCTLPTGDWGVCGVQLQVGNTAYPENTTRFLLPCELLVTGCCCTAQTLQKNYQSAKLTRWAHWGSNTTIRQITHQLKPDSMSSTFRGAS